MMPRARLGAVEVGSSSLFGDATRDAFVQWVQAVHAARGIATTYPYHGTLNVAAWPSLLGPSDTWGSPAARYKLADANNFDNEPDNVASTPTGDYAYYLAPHGVTRWALNSNGAFFGMLDPDQMREAGTDQSPPDKPWYDELEKVGKYLLVGGAVLLAFKAFEFFPKPRDWE